MRRQQQSYTLSTDTVQWLEEMAREHNTQPSKVVEHALGVVRSLQRFSDRGYTLLKTREPERVAELLQDLKTEQPLLKRKREPLVQQVEFVDGLLSTVTDDGRDWSAPGR